MGFIRKNWIWIAVGVLVYMNWSKVKTMIPFLNKENAPGDNTPETKGTKVPESK